MKFCQNVVLSYAKISNKIIHLVWNKKLENMFIMPFKTHVTP